MRIRNYISALCGISCLLAMNTPTAETFTAVAEENSPVYSYEIIPLLSPFNEYFYVKTENPDPFSFRFVDKESVYGESASISVLDAVYSDVRYENLETLRVNGGYIFKGNATDGGEVSLQIDIQTEPPQPVTVYNLSTGTSEIQYRRNEIWQDTDQNFTLPVLYDETDYLIHTYATESEFFDNLDAVQSGFSSICLYSGSYIRGELERASEFWAISNSPHVDQTFYIQSPYQRKENLKLFASAIYPFRYDSLGFPSVMGSVAKRLDSEATYQQNSSNHYQIDVTHAGETRSYGGQGHGSGQGISEDKIKYFFDFENEQNLTLEGSRELLNYYSSIEMEDDIPKEDTLTWEFVCDTAGDGAWIRLIGISSVFGGAYGCYAYLYKKNDDNYYFTSEAGYGGSIYWSGSLGYASDTWVDGRYVDSYERFVPNETFDKHPESNILISNAVVPSVSYQQKHQYNSSTEQYDISYTDIEITEITKTVKYIYNKEKNIWTPDSNSFSSSDYQAIAEMTEKNLIDEKYLDMLELTYDEVIALNIDGNTDKDPEHGYIYDGSAKAGTPFGETSEIIPEKGDITQDGSLETTDIISLQKYLHGKQAFSQAQYKTADMNQDGNVNIYDFILLKQALLNKK